MKAAHYVRRIESAWSALIEAPVVISVREFALIAEWHARGVPLKLVLETLEDGLCRRRARHRPRPRSLTYLRHAVEEAWSVVREGRLEAASAEDEGRAGVLRSARERWRAARDGAAPHGPLRGLLSELLARLDAGESAAAIESELDARLVPTLGPERCRTLERLVDERLEPFRRRMSAAVLESTRRRALVERLRRELDLPGLQRDAEDRATGGE